MTTEQFTAYYNGLNLNERIKLMNDCRDPYDPSDATDICITLPKFVRQLTELHIYDPHRLATLLNEIDEGAKCWVYCWGSLYNIWDLNDLERATGDTATIAEYYAELID